MRRLTPFFSFYGAKYNLAPYYPNPENNLIIEPFAGSAAYACLHYERQVKLYDVDDNICRLWAYLIRASKEEILSLPLIEPEMLVDDLDCHEEGKLLIGWWLQGGVSSPRKSLSTWAASEGGVLDKVNYWSELCRNRLAGQIHQINHWTITQKSYEEIESVDATWFIDPPYQCKAGRHYRHNVIDFDHLSDWCQLQNGLVIVCENENSERWLPFKRLKENTGQRKKRNLEMIWTNKRVGQLSLFSDL